MFFSLIPFPRITCHVFWPIHTVGFYCFSYLAWYGINIDVTRIHLHQMTDWSMLINVSNWMCSVAVISLLSIQKKVAWENSSLGPGGYSWEFLVGVCRKVLKILTIFQTKKGHFSHPLSDLGLGLFLESTDNFLGPESCFLFAAFTFKINVSIILKINNI